MPRTFAHSWTADNALRVNCNSILGEQATREGLGQLREALLLPAAGKLVFGASVVYSSPRQVRMATTSQIDGDTHRADREVIRFSTYEVHLRAGELFRAGRKIKLQVQPFQVLAMLLEHPGEVVAREELHKRLWPADTFVDFDHSLNTAIKKLRQALSDDQKNPRFIETLPKRGYRFIGKLAQAAKLPAPAPPPARDLAKSAARPSWVGRVVKISTDGQSPFALVSADEESAAERERLDAVNDDVGLSLLIAAQKLFLVAHEIPVRILEVKETASCCLVRILDGEHYGKTAVVPLKCIGESATAPPRAKSFKRGG